MLSHTISHYLILSQDDKASACSHGWDGLALARSALHDAAAACRARARQLELAAQLRATAAAGNAAGRPQPARAAARELGELAQRQHAAALGGLGNAATLWLADTSAAAAADADDVAIGESAVGCGSVRGPPPATAAAVWLQSQVDCLMAAGVPTWAPGGGALCVERAKALYVLGQARLAAGGALAAAHCFENARNELLRRYGGLDLPLETPVPGAEDGGGGTEPTEQERAWWRWRLTEADAMVASASGRHSVAASLFCWLGQAASACATAAQQVQMRAAKRPPSQPKMTDRAKAELAGLTAHRAGMLRHRHEIVRRVASSAIGEADAMLHLGQPAEAARVLHIAVSSWQAVSAEGAGGGAAAIARPAPHACSLCRTCRTGYVLPLCGAASASASECGTLYPHLLIRLGDALLETVARGTVEKVVLTADARACDGRWAAVERATDCYLAAKAWAIAEHSTATASVDPLLTRAEVRETDSSSVSRSEQKILPGTDGLSAEGLIRLASTLDLAAPAQPRAIVLEVALPVEYKLGLLHVAAGRFATARAALRRAFALALDGNQADERELAEEQSLLLKAPSAIQQLVKELKVMLEPLLQAKGLCWRDALPALGRVSTAEELHDALLKPTAYVEKLVAEANGALFKCSTLSCDAKKGYRLSRCAFWNSDRKRVGRNGSEGGGEAAGAGMAARAAYGGSAALNSRKGSRDATESCPSSGAGSLAGHICR
eukprot:SAG31_NODE_1162_length_9594_cov_3.045498_4_plen_724_part_00